MSAAQQEQPAQEIPISGRKRAPRAEPQSEPPPHATPPTTENTRTTARDPERDPGNTAQDESRRRPGNARADSFNAMAWLLEGVTGFVGEARQSNLGLSPEFWQHFYAARRESLLTARALIDSLLEHNAREADRAQEKETRKQRRGNIRINPE